MQHKLGWRPSLPDQRDYVFSVPARVALPPEIDLRTSGNLPEVYDQGNLGSCVSNAVAAAYEYEEARQKTGPFMPSRLFLYYNERMIEDTVASDAGASIRDGFKTIARQGVCPETDWPYDITRFADAPPAQAYAIALGDRAIRYHGVPQSSYAIKYALSQGFPIVIGFTVYDSFESDAVAASGIVPMPAMDEGLVGGHAVLIVGYKMIGAPPYWIVRNSWSALWGDQGYFYMPEAYFLNPQLASDLWLMSKVA
jgi:C1A family cysteine protease